MSKILLTVAIVAITLLAWMGLGGGFKLLALLILGGGAVLLVLTWLPWQKWTKKNEPAPVQKKSQPSGKQSGKK
jgi:hypothetical protein